MGVIITARNFSPQNQAGLLKPIVYCCPYAGVTEHAVAIDLELAQALKAIKPKRRTMQIERCFADILSKLPDGVVLKDFDVLFNPDYKVDVMTMMVNTCKAKPFGILWPGTYDGTRHVYAEEGFQDYKTYDVSSYDITCIV